MDIYHSWIYQRVFNTPWFMWTVVYSVFALNVLSPAMAWYRIHKKQRRRQIKK